MLTQIADGVLLHTSAFMQTNTVVVQGRDGVLLVDPGVLASEIACLAADLRELGQGVVVGFSTHPHWDHLLWEEALGTPPRYATARCAANAQEGLAEPGVKDRIAEHLPPDIGPQVPLDLLGDISGLPADATEIPWDGPRVRVLEHQGHAVGHAALLVEQAGVLVVGDMLSDLFDPMLDTEEGADPVEDYLHALRLLEVAADEVTTFVPGHGSIGGREEMRRRIDRDRAFVHALSDSESARPVPAADLSNV
jgi:glyoxylase-like metal-dependent hydrolase (beta-lactamase superfamily II)